MPDADKLERLLDRLSAEAAATQPFIVEFATSAGARLGIGLGASAGSVLSFKQSDDPPYYMSAGRPESAGDNDVGFYYQGQWSEFPDEALVPVELARKAVEQFLATGERPEAQAYDAASTRTTPPVKQHAGAARGYDDRTQVSRDRARVSRGVLATKAPTEAAASRTDGSQRKPSSSRSHRRG